jgi:hypothetical protein
VRLPDAPSSIGARIRLEGVDAPVQVFVAGEGLTSDRTTQYVFGLPHSGPAPSALVVEWANARVTRIEKPRLNDRIVVVGP